VTVWSGEREREREYGAWLRIPKLSELRYDYGRIA